MQSIVTKGEWADDNIVFDCIEHFIPILNVDACPSNVIKHILFDQRRVSGVYNDASLMAVLNGIVLEYAPRKFEREEKERAGVRETLH